MRLRLEGIKANAPRLQRDFYRDSTGTGHSRWQLGPGTDGDFEFRVYVDADEDQRACLEAIITALKSVPNLVIDN